MAKKETPKEWRERVLSVGFASSGMPSRRPHEKRSAEREKEWDRDMPAYKRLRRDGLQPDKIDGSAELEAKLK